MLSQSLPLKCILCFSQGALSGIPQTDIGRSHCNATRSLPEIAYVCNNKI